MSYPNSVKVWVTVRPNKRTQQHQMVMFMGLGHLQAMFDHNQYQPDIKSAGFYYPETWLNAREEQEFVTKCAELLPNADITILTHSPIILSTVRRVDIGVIDATCDPTPGTFASPNTPTILDKFTREVL